MGLVSADAHLVGLENDHNVICVHVVAGLLLPGDDRPLGDGIAHAGDIEEKLGSGGGKGAH